MATIKPTIVIGNDGVLVASWGTMTASDDGDAISAAGYEALTVHVVSAGAGTAQVAGSNDGTNYVNIGSPLAANTLTQLAVNPLYLKISDVATADITVTLTGRRAGR